MALIKTNSGLLPNKMTLHAHGYLERFQRTNGLWASVLAQNTLPNLGAATGIVPFVSNKGLTIWLNSVTPWHDDQYSAAGATGGGSTGVCMATGINGTDFSADTSAGMTVLMSQAPIAGSTYLMGYGNNSGSDSFGLNANNTAFGAPSACNFSCWNTSGGAGFLTHTGVTDIGYLSGNRTSAGAFAIYFANSATPHAALVSGATTGGGRSAHTITVFGLNAYELTNPFTTFPTTLSFIQIHEGWTATQSQANFYGINTFRQMLGGGAV